MDIRSRFSRLSGWIRSLGFRSGCVVAAFCAAFYVISFAQMALPLSIEMKGALWVIFFGLAKTAQYTAILILGREGIKHLRSILRFRRK